MSASQGIFEDRGTRQFAMSGYTGHKQGMSDYDNPVNISDSNGRIPGK